MPPVHGITKLIAGDNLDFVTDVDEYPPTDGWTLKYRLTPRFTTPVQAPITLTAATYETTRYRVQETPTTTEDWAAGVYSWASWVEQSGQRITLEHGQELTIAADPATIAQGTDVRSEAVIALANVQAALKGVATKNVLSYEIAGRSLQHYSVDELLKLRDRLMTDVKRERAAAMAAAGQPTRRQIFGSPARV